MWRTMPNQHVYELAESASQGRFLFGLERPTGGIASVPTTVLGLTRTTFPLSGGDATRDTDEPIRGGAHGRRRGTEASQATSRFRQRRSPVTLAHLASIAVNDTRTCNTSCSVD
jgi:hypothetical protein